MQTRGKQGWGLAACALLLATACGDDTSATTAGSTTGATTTAGPTSNGSSTVGPADTTAGSSDGSGSSGTTGGGEYPGTPPELHCPGDPSGICDSTEGPLMAAAAVRSIVPECYESWTDLAGDGTYDAGEDDFLDCGCDRLCPADRGYPGADEGEGDGVFQRAFIGGFQHNRPASGVRGDGVGLPGVGEGDGISLRAVVLEQGDARLALVAADTVGIFRPDVELVRTALQEAGHDVDFLVIHAIHDHEGPDTMGLWGPDLLTSGYDPAYGEQWRAAAVDAVGTAIGELRPVASMIVGNVDASTYDPVAGVANVLRDSRDPWIVDPTVGAARLVDERGETIVTLLSWACHPETVADENTLWSADYIHALRRTVEQGSIWSTAPERTGVGGPAIFISGALGGMMTSLGVQVTNPDGQTYQSASFEKADSIGQIVGEMALDALDVGEVIEDPQLRFMAQSFELVVDNTNFIFAFENGLLEREIIDVGGQQGIVTEMALIDVGPLRMITVPGELLPELAVGGYDGSHVHAPGVPLVDPANPNPPDLDAAPVGPYLLERVAAGDRLRTPWIIGLGNDELGYIIPEYDFILHDLLPYFDEADGDHYEETNSVGPHMAGVVDAQADALIDFAEWLAG
ncbi:hypothetical protein [Paraliomyxa miuraensis]|uniref:hypothetical protein n=1 Tax=Paraliomyxa miuraensis TaxID=376150 RepID=UPI00224F0E62|nr:hypothetical protein [Paraliomyxa miuraensis]MCX4241789.1 hypothetical protein [Paraliomyxa miuraensis]